MIGRNQRAFVSVLAASVFLTPFSLQANDEASRPAPPETTTNDGSSGIGIPKGSISAVASNDASSVSLTIGPKSQNLRPNGEIIPSLTISAPLDKETGRGSLFSESGVGNKFSAKFGLTIVDFDFLPDVTEAEFEARAKFQQNCNINARSLKGYTDIQPGPRQQQLQQAFLSSTCVAPTAAKICTTPELLKLGLLDATEERALCDPQEKADERDLWIFNLNGSIGYNEFSYLDPSDFSSQKTDRTSFAFSAGAGWHPGEDQPFFAAGYQYKRDFEASKSKILCPASSPDDPFLCRQSAFAAPKRNVDHNIFGLVRSANIFGPNDEDKPNLAPIVELRGKYDIKDKLFGVSLPIYLFLDKDKSFKGGVRVDWEERIEEQEDGSEIIEDDFTFGVFIAKSFDFLGVF